MILGIRPEDLEDAALEPDAAAGNRLHGVVRLRESLGSLVMAHIMMNAVPARTEMTKSSPPIAARPKAAACSRATVCW